MRLSLCPPPAGPLERAPLTALWASAAASSVADARPTAAEVADGMAGPRCSGYWTCDERYVLRVAVGDAERWYVGELDEMAPSELVATPALADVIAADRPGRLRTMLVGRQHGRRHLMRTMKLRVRRLPRP